MHLIIMFIARFYYRFCISNTSCVGQKNVTTQKIIWNCINNSITVSFAVF